MLRARINRSETGLSLMSRVRGLDLSFVNDVLGELYHKIFYGESGGVFHLSYNDTNSFIDINLWTGESSRGQYIYNDQNKSFILDVAFLLSSEVRKKHLGFLINNYSLSKDPNTLLHVLEQLILKLDKNVQYILPLDIALVTDELQEKVAPYITDIECCEQNIIKKGMFHGRASK